ncbi:hypothetical protein [Methylophilus sp. 3sh_L]|uniref:hypothetical protein n=1 Tax=Methylophilus sp. 3sh_L TaxID=3377114 RepID=UPI00398EC8C1
MTGITESNNWANEVRRFEPEDVVTGGEGSVDNLVLEQLASRCNWLRLMITALCTAESVPVVNNQTTQFLTALDSRIASAIAGLVDSSPAALDTLNELAAALGDDANFATTMTNALALKAPLASPDFSGTPKVPTAAAGTSSKQIANTEFVQAEIAAIASGKSVNGGFYNIEANATGTNALVNIKIKELVTNNGAGDYLLTSNWNDTLNLTIPGAGGLDTGAVTTSTWYYIFGITKDDGTKAFLGSLSSTAPTLPAGFTKWARIGSLRTDATANKFPLAFKQMGTEVRYIVSAGSNVQGMRIMASGTAGSPSTPTWVPVATGAFIPPTAYKILVSALFNTATSSQIGMVAPNNNYGAFADPSNPPPIAFAGSASTGGAAYQTTEMLLESSNIFWASSHTTTSILACIGWIDNF